MKTLVFRNPSRTLKVEFITDLIEGNDAFTVMEIRGREQAEVEYGINFEQLPSSLSAFKALATSKGLILDQYDEDKTEVQDSSVTLNITTTTLPDSVTALWEKEITIVTYNTFANTGQADYLHLLSEEGLKFAIWMDKDEAGTVPTGTLYLASDYQIQVDIATGDNAIAVAAKVIAAIEADESWTRYAKITIVDNVDGTLTFTQDVPGVTTNALPKNASDGGAGSIGVVIDNEGVDGTEYDETLAVVGGNGNYTFEVTVGALPDGLTLNPTTGVINGRHIVAAVFTFSVTVTDKFDIEDTQALSIEIVV